MRTSREWKKDTLGNIFYTRKEWVVEKGEGPEVDSKEDQIEEHLGELNMRNWKARACNWEKWNRLLKPRVVLMMEICTKVG